MFRKRGEIEAARVGNPAPAGSNPLAGSVFIHRQERHGRKSDSPSRRMAWDCGSAPMGTIGTLLRSVQFL